LEYAIETAKITSHGAAHRAQSALLDSSAIAFITSEDRAPVKASLV
jgi:hypothetical protein